jgi:flagellar motor switch protein FliM
MILLIAMEARIGNFSGIINVIYPYVVLEPILSLLSAQTLYAIGSHGATEETRDRTRRVLNRVELPVSVELGVANCTFRELLELEVNDILVLNTKTVDDLVVRVNGIDKYRCVPGLLGKHRGAQITEVVADREWLGTPRSPRRK